MSKIVNGTPGVCYILSNASMPGVLKIGASTDTAENRARQLTASTAAPTPFVVLYYRATSDCTATEAAMHRTFADRRVNEGREFFSVSLFEAARTLDTLCGESFSRLKPATPYAELFATFPDDDSPRGLTKGERQSCALLARKLRGDNL